VDGDAPDRAPRQVEEPTLRRGDGVGRFVVLEHLGTGGMGVVYSAYDPQLDRRVALKLLRPDRAREPEAARASLLREAKAMARLSHPNVVAVHEAYTANGQVVIAMELVEGTTVKGWLAERPRSLREVLGVFLQAGRGLAAAHAEGLVHRDFKPDNVLIGRDGRARVSDFGLARAYEGEAASAEGAVEAPAAPTEALTATGFAAGTPAYMAPEQHLGRRADARSDQFSFAVALYEALYGERPFSPRAEGELTPSASLALEAIAGRVREAPRKSPVPPWVRKVVRRGLEPDPARRFESMEAMLTALERDPARTRRRILLAAGGLALVVAVAYGALSRRANCAGGADEMWSTAFGPATRSAVRASMLALPRALGAETWARFERAVDAYGASWVSGYREACLATKVRLEQSPQLMDLEMACLKRRLDGVKSLAEAFTRADDQAVSRAVTAVSALPPVEDCKDAVRLLRRVPLPADPAVRAQVSSLEERLARAKALEDLSKIEQAGELVQKVVPEAKAVGYAPLSAEALYLQGDVEEYRGHYDRSEEALYQAIDLGLAGREYDTVARASAALIWVEGIDRDRRDDGHRWSDFSESVIEGMGGNAFLEGGRLNNLASLLFDEARFREAEAVNRRAVEAYERVRPVDQIHIATALNNLGNSLYALARYGEALQTHDRAGQLWAEKLGPSHPLVAASLGNQADALREMGRFDEAVKRVEQARRIVEDVPHTGLFENRYGLMLEAAGRYDDARTALEEALAEALRARGEADPLTGEILANLSDVERRLGHPSEALAHAERARATLEHSRGPNHPTTALALTEVGRALLDLDRAREAIPVLDQAVKALTGSEAFPAQRAFARFALAEALVQAGADARRARSLAEAARTLYSSVVAGYGKELAEVDSWLRAHPGP